MKEPARFVIEPTAVEITTKRKLSVPPPVDCFQAAFWVAAGAVMGGGFGLGVILAVARAVGFIGKAL